MDEIIKVFRDSIKHKIQIVVGSRYNEPFRHGLGAPRAEFCQWEFRHE